MWTFSPDSRLTLAATQTEAGRGGIARVSRLSVKALAAAHRPVRVRSLLDRPETIIAGVPGKAAAGCRLPNSRLASIGDALALGCVPVRPCGSGPCASAPPFAGLMAIWLHGIEIWGDELSAGRAAALRAADRLLVNSRYTLERFEAEHFPLQNARVVHLATEEDQPAPVRTPSGRPVALCFGRVRQGRHGVRKGHVRGDRSLASGRVCQFPMRAFSWPAAATVLTS